MGAHCRTSGEEILCWCVASDCLRLPDSSVEAAVVVVVVVVVVGEHTVAVEEHRVAVGDPDTTVVVVVVVVVDTDFGIVPVLDIQPAVGSH